MPFVEIAFDIMTQNLIAFDEMQFDINCCLLIFLQLIVMQRNPIKLT
jgi:hypothetical protein